MFGIIIMKNEKQKTLDKINKIKKEIKEREAVHNQELKAEHVNYAEADYDNDLNDLNIELEKLIASQRQRKVKNKK
tara:strand:- start:18986 stop:19213 length:228 start_codon:yes stop_codon:yes gene_type:complete